MPAIPLYFASSYALVKPYVNGFDANLLDAPSLKRVRIDADWRMPQNPTRALSQGIIKTPARMSTETFCKGVHPKKSILLKEARA
jgi:hypothetical protein